MQQSASVTCPCSDQSAVSGALKIDITLGSG